ncbi:MAG: sigma 54-dependent Fis family transcriptional regulator [Polyangiaceae bacterium]|nr:sigma 54-dependent Fis family transcriptional regulator [Polyangiaceae bacterium]MBK8942793.1 sigma 54-dependent Fis family transcriptional regulator [Polyangiaceae bacterium]
MNGVGPTTESLEASEGLLVRSFSVLVLDGADAGRRVNVTTGRAVIGTHDSADVRLSDGAVSRFHAELAIEGEGIQLRDLGSRNGIYLAGVRIREALLPQGAVFEVGRSHLKVELETTINRRDASPATSFGKLVGRSPRMRQAFSLLERAARSDATVLLTGETGTGKEAAAKSIHEQSARKVGPFVVVDCSSVPASLFEAELFGHEKGAFTSAHAAREGAFELAEGGTLFIDEIGELSLDLQPKLLRVLEQREAKRLGSQKVLPVDVRVVAATHRDLRAEVNARRFRADLYYRLAVVEITLPPLRERGDDMPMLVAHLGASIGERLRVDPTPLSSPAVLDELRRHAWPGNVRELRNYLERYLVLGGAEPRAPEEVTIDPHQLDLEVSLKEGRERAISGFERAYLQGILERHGGNVSEAARAASVDRVHFYRLLWKHGLTVKRA